MAKVIKHANHACFINLLESCVFWLICVFHQYTYHLYYLSDMLQFAYIFVIQCFSVISHLRVLLIY